MSGKTAIATTTAVPVSDPEPSDVPQVAIGDTVHFVLRAEDGARGDTAGRVRPATVVSLLEDEKGVQRPNLRVHLDEEDYGPAETLWRKGAEYDADGAPGTWHPRTV